MKMVKEYKKEIIIGVLLICLQPLFNYIGNLLVKLFIMTSKSYSENYYKSIAHNNENEFSEWNSFILNFLLTIFILLIVFSIDTFVKILSIRSSKRVRKIENIKTKLLTNDNLEKEVLTISSENESLSKVNKLQVAEENLKSKEGRLRKLIYVTYGLTFFLIIIIFTMHAKNISVSNQNLIFKNDLTIIAPYVEEHDILEFKSKWAQMENSEDFTSIKAKIKAIKNVNQLK